MRHYPEAFENWSSTFFAVSFSEIAKKKHWHYVALSLQPSQVEFWHFSSFSRKMWKYGRGTMWHYVALS